MVTPRQREANRVNAFKSTGPKSSAGKRRASLNATKHGLSLPVDERLFGDQIKVVCALIREECDSENQAIELAKRIIDFERNDLFLHDLGELSRSEDIIYQGDNSLHIAWLGLLKDLRARYFPRQGQAIGQEERTVELNRLERSNEPMFTNSYFKLQDKVARAKPHAARKVEESALRYQKRAINQLVKGVRALGRGEEI